MERMRKEESRVDKRLSFGSGEHNNNRRVVVCVHPDLMTDALYSTMQVCNSQTGAARGTRTKES